MKYKTFLFSLLFLLLIVSIGFAAKPPQVFYPVAIQNIEADWLPAQDADGPGYYAVTVTADIFSLLEEDHEFHIVFDTGEEVIEESMFIPAGQSVGWASNFIYYSTGRKTLELNIDGVEYDFGRIRI